MPTQRISIYGISDPVGQSIIERIHSKLLDGKPDELLYDFKSPLTSLMMSGIKLLETNWFDECIFFYAAYLDTYSFREALIQRLRSSRISEKIGELSGAWGTVAGLRISNASRSIASLEAYCDKVGLRESRANLQFDEHEAFRFLTQLRECFSMAEGGSEFAIILVFEVRGPSRDRTISRSKRSTTFDALFV